MKERRDEKTAAQRYGKAAEQGDAHAQFHLGLCLQEGVGCEKNPEQAVMWYHLCARQGHAPGQCCLGRCLEQGIGCEKNLEEAVTWYRE
ncbi:MAG: sel1 repeat family protein, partial [Thermoguttaceae bacterium]|nr:sel1 repeat family protein [Thermoguttaceae bacterium]